MNDPAAWHAQARRDLAEGRHAEAHACLIRAAELHPGDDTIRADLARALYLSGRADEAVPLFRDLVARHPDNASYGIDLGRALRATAAYSEAIETYRCVLKHLPNPAVALNNIANCQLALGHIDEAIATLREAKELSPELVDAHYNLGLALLAAGQMREGWEEYRWRMRLPAHWIDGKPLVEWNGEAMPGKVLFVRPEQGLGDTIQFCRYVSMIAPRARVVLGVPRQLHRLLSQLPGVERVITEGDPKPAFDAECVVVSLPRLLSAPAPSNGGPVPYLRADPVAVANWRARLDALPAPKVGLVWAGSPGLGAINLVDRRRSIPLAALAPLRGATFISLQKGPAAARARRPPEGMVLIDWSEELRDFADTAALIMALDLVISVDTAVAHLAGALGRPVWMLNRSDTDWRWGVSGATTPWYPTMRIFRQASQGDWTAPIAEVANALRLTLADADTAAGNPGQAESRPRQGRRNDPDELRIQAASARELLLAERWAEAWPVWALSHTRPGWPTPLWNGTAMDGETLLLHTNEIVDVCLFGRFVAAAVEKSRAHVVLSVPPRMRRLMMGWTNVTVATERCPPHDRHCPFALLPVVFRARTNSIPDIDLCPSPAIEAREPRQGLRVGAAFDDPALLTAIVRIPGIDVVTLRGDIEFDDIVQLDLVIAGDNLIAHLAAALTRPVWLLSPRGWPWAPGREDNPWYPTSRQFHGDTHEAVVAALRAFATSRPDDQLFSYANDCYRRRDYRAAATSFRQALALNPGHPGALGNLAMTMLTLGRPDSAVRYAEHAVRLVPASQPLRVRLGLALHACGRFDDAVARLNEAHTMDPGHADTLLALGNALGAAGASDAAIAILSQAVALRPENDGYHTNLAYALLRAGQWEAGWREHARRPQRPRIARPWDGQALPDAPLLLRHEQGIGDIIQFCRFAPMAAQRSGAETFLTVPPPLRNLLRGLRGVSILSTGDPMPANARQFPLLSLPMLFNLTPSTMPAAPYLHADPAKAAFWRARTATLPGLRVGLTWAGNPRLGTASFDATDRRRSLPDAALAPLGELPGITFVSLQVGDAVTPGVETVDWTAELTDFAETAALITALDLIISVDTAVAHLTGALGQPVWLLNRFDTDWRWMAEGDHSIWYPAMRQFRQSAPGDWAGVIERVKQALPEFATER